MRVGIAEIRRQKGRFLFITGALSFLVLLVLLLSALSDGLFYGNTGAIRNADAQAYAFSSDAEGSFVRSRLPDAAVAELSSTPGVSAASPLGLLLTGGEGPDGGVDVALFGFEPDGAGAPTELVEGRLPRPEENGVSAVSTALRDQGVVLGSTITLGTVAIEVVGFVEDAEYQGQSSMWVTVPTWAEARAAVRPETRGETGVITAVALQLDDGVSVDDLESPAGTSVLTTAESYLAIPGVEQQRSTFSSIVTTTYLVAAIVVALFFALLTLEKRDLFAALKALGASTRRLAGILFSQAIVTSAIALVAGAGLAWLLGRAVPDQVPVLFLPGTLITVAISTFVSSLVGAVFSLRRIARIDPATALGGTL